MRSNPPPVSAKFPIGKSLNANTIQCTCLAVLAELIKSPAFEELSLQAQKIRKHSLEEYRIFKEKYAPIFMPHACIDPGKRKILKNCQKHTGYLAIEYDNLTREELQLAKERVQKVPWVALAYTSLSGLGLCVLVYAPFATVQNHEYYYGLIAQDLDHTLGLIHDPTGKNLNRLRFFAYDPDLYLNPNPLPCPIETKPSKEAKSSPQASTKYLYSNFSKEYRLICKAYEILKVKGISYFSNTHKSWRDAAYGLFHCFERKTAKKLYHKLASLSPGYDEKEASKKLRAIERSFIENQNSPQKKLGFGSLIFLFKQAVGYNSVLINQLYQKAHTDEEGKIIDFRDPYRKELSYYCPGTAKKVKTRRAALVRFIFRLGGYLKSLAPKHCKIETLASRFEVSPSVISSDLSALEKAGFLKISLQNPGTFSRAKSLILTDYTLDILCKAKMPEPKTYAREIWPKNSDSSKSAAFSENSPIYINIPLVASGVSPKDPERSEDLYSKQPKLLKINQKEEIAASPSIIPGEREGSRGGKTPLGPISSPKQGNYIPLDAELLSQGRKAWELFCANLRQVSKHKPGIQTAKEFARILKKYPDKILSIAKQVQNIAPHKLPYWWLKDERFKLQVEGEILNETLGPKDLQQLSRKIIPPAERMVLISKPSIPFPILSLQGWQKNPLSVPCGIVYCTSIQGELYINRSGKKMAYKHGFEQIA